MWNILSMCCWAVIYIYSIIYCTDLTGTVPYSQNLEDIHIKHYIIYYIILSTTSTWLYSKMNKVRPLNIWVKSTKYSICWVVHFWMRPHPTFTDLRLVSVRFAQRSIMQSKLLVIAPCLNMNLICSSNIFYCIKHI